MSWFTQSDFDEVETRFRAGLQSGLRFHVESETEAEDTVFVALPRARKEWEEAGGEKAAIALLARVGAETWREIFADPGSEVDKMPGSMRRFALESQLARYLEMVRFEAIIAETDAHIAKLRAEGKEDGRDRLGEIDELERQKMRVFTVFYDHLLPMDGGDEDDGAAPALCPAGPVAPRKGPGDSKAWEAADELPRNT